MSESQGKEDGDVPCVGCDTGKSLKPAPRHAQCWPPGHTQAPYVAPSPENKHMHATVRHGKCPCFLLILNCQCGSIHQQVCIRPNKMGESMASAMSNWTNLCIVVHLLTGIKYLVYLQQTNTFTHFLSQILSNINVLNREVDNGWVLLSVESVLGESLKVYQEKKKFNNLIQYISIYIKVISLYNIIHGFSHISYNKFNCYLLRQPGVKKVMISEA